MNGIQNDKWIIEQSTPPAFLVTSIVMDNEAFTGHATSLRVKEVQEISHSSEAELNQLVNTRRSFAQAIGNEFAVGVKDFRPILQEDLLAWGWKPMIEPFTAEQTRYRDTLLTGMPDPRWNLVDLGSETYRRERVISYGVSSFGYDVRIADEFMIFTNVNNAMVDPKNFDEKSFVHFKGDVCVIPPNSFVLARSLEYFRMPRNVSGLVLGKSTYARCGVNCIATPLEPGWEGHITLEYINGTPLPARLYANEGAAQVQFFEGEAPLVSYADRGGKYQGQRGITLPKA